MTTHSIRLSYDRVAIIGLVALYGVVLNIYYPWLSRQLNDPAYPYSNPDWMVFIIAWLAYLYPALLAPTRIQKPSQGVVWLLYIMLFAPTVFIPHYTVGMESWRIVLYNAVIAGLFTALIVTSRLPSRRWLPRIRVGWTGYLLLVLGIGVLLQALFIHSLGYSFRFVSPLDVYGIRSEFRESVQQIGQLPSYAILWMGFGVAPFLLVLGVYLVRARRFLEAAVFLGVSLHAQLYIFSVAGFKSVLFSFMMVSFLIFVVGYKKNVQVLLLGMLSLYAVSWALFLGGFNFLALHLVRRLLVVPGLNAGYYYEFFSEHPLYILSHGVLRGLIESNYDSAPPFVIGEAYYGSFITSANANFWADGFANFGFVGMLLATALLCAVLRILDSVSKHHILRLTFPALGMAVYALSNSGLLTTLNTYGLLIVLGLLWLAPPAKPCLEER